ncbi:MAG: M20/M25/M40 family metallo-hydrolase [Balneola sp.]
MNVKQTKVLLIASAVLLLTAPKATAQEVAEEKFQIEINTLASQKAVLNAFRIIDDLEPETIADLIHLTEIPAPPFKEEVRAEEFKRMLEKAGADRAWIDKEGNVIALRKGTEGKRTVAVDAHLDTVFPEGTDVTVKQRGDTLFAPGIGDDTRGLSMVLALLKTMEQAGLETKSDILFIGTVGEEGQGDLRGVKYLFQSGEYGIDSWISIDGGEIGRVNNAGLGSKRYRAIFKGRGGHSWGAFGLANPHHALGVAINNFTKRAHEFVSTGPRTSFNVGIIGGGTSVNSIPFESFMEVDMRSVSPERLNQIDSLFKSEMMSSLREYNRSGVRDSVSLELVKMGDRPSGEVDVKTPLIQRAIAATTFMGAEPRLTRGSTNSNIPIYLGVPSVTIGRGGVGSGGHSLGEWWINKNGAEAIKLALIITLAEAEYVNN